MSSAIAGSLLLFAVLMFGQALASQGDPLKCYQCAVEQNSQCTDEYLLPCPAGQAFDRCMTTISYSKQNGHEIRKSCALAPCNLRDPSASSGLGLDTCDRSQPSYDCVWCCRGDGCNKDAATALSSPHIFILLILSAISLSHFAPH